MTNTEPEQRAIVYRFHDSVALAFLTSHQTFYLSETLATKLGEALLEYAEDIRVETFTASPMGTRTFAEESAQ